VRILVVSNREYAITSRGIDVMTKYLADSGHRVDHLLFYTRTVKSPKNISSNLRQLYFYDKYKLYRDKFKYFLPGFILKFYFKSLLQSQDKLFFNRYDLVILEGGYPIYLSMVIVKPIIYRQSDPIEVVFNSNRRHYKKIEFEIIEKSIAVSSACRKEYFHEKYLYKYTFWHSGYIPPLMEKYGIIERNEFVFFGLTPIDYLLIEKIASRYPECTIKIIGSYIDKIYLKNVIFTGYLEFQKCVEILSSACILIIPLTNKFSKMLKKYSYTAKIFLAIHLGIPIL
jgi:hypothetical protein